MRSCIVVVLFGLPSIAGEPVSTSVQAEMAETHRLRAKAALALAFAQPTCTPSTYAKHYAQALKENRPLVVFVGQPTRLVKNTVCLACDSFAELPSPGVVIGLPAEGTLRRVDLPGRPSEEQIREAIAGFRAERAKSNLPDRAGTP